MAALICWYVVASIYQQFIFSVDICKEPFDITTFSLLQCTVIVVSLKKVNLILQVVWSVVLRCGRKKTHVWIYPCIRTNLLYQFIKRLVHQCGTVAELMAFVNDNKAIILFLECSTKIARIAAVVIVIFAALIFGNISDASSCNEVNVWRNLLVRIFVEHGYSLLPTRLNGRRSNDQYFTFSSIVFWYGQETLDDERTNNRLAKSHHICQHKATMFVHNADTPLNSFYLIFQFVDVRWQISFYLLSE